MKSEEKEVRTIGEGIGFERIRRITGYLVGTVDRSMDFRELLIRSNYEY